MCEGWLHGGEGHPAGKRRVVFLVKSKVVRSKWNMSNNTIGAPVVSGRHEYVVLVDSGELLNAALIFPRDIALPSRVLIQARDGLAA